MKPNRNNRLLAVITLAGFAFTAPAAHAADGTWLGNDGNWNATGTWSGGTIADGIGFTANFTGLDITANKTITLAADRTIGNISFTDLTTASNNLLITGANTLTLDVSKHRSLATTTKTVFAFLANATLITIPRRT